MSADKITAYKGFNDDLTCRGFQFEVGGTYKTDGPVEQCRSGFHACETAIDVLSYYGPVGTRFAEVLLDGEIDRGDGSDSKIAAAKITVVAELSLPDFIDRAVKQIVAMAKSTKKKSGDRSVASNAGDLSVASNAGYQSVASNAGDRSVAYNAGDQSVAYNAGYQSVASNAGDRSVAYNAGYQSVASNAGDQSVASNAGDQSVAYNAGDRSVASNAGDLSVAYNAGDLSVASNAGYQSVASNAGDRSVASNAGDQSVASNAGDQSVASNAGDLSVATNTGYLSVASVCGKASTAVVTGVDGKVMAEREGCSLFANEIVWNGSEYEVKSNACGITGRNGIEPGVWYVAKDGKLIPVAQPKGE